MNEVNEISSPSKDLLLLILDMQGIEERLRAFERKYHLWGKHYE